MEKVLPFSCSHVQLLFFLLLLNLSPRRRVCLFTQIFPFKLSLWYSFITSRFPHPYRMSPIIRLCQAGRTFRELKFLWLKMFASWNLPKDSFNCFGTNKKLGVHAGREPYMVEKQCLDEMTYYFCCSCNSFKLMEIYIRCIFQTVF